MVNRSTFTERLEARARRLGCKIAFPEAGDPRVVEAAVLLARRSIVKPVLVGEPEEAAPLLSLFEAEGEVGVVDCRTGPLNHAAAMLVGGLFDGVVAGAVHTTGEVVRVGLRRVGLRPGARTLSSSFLMEVRDFRGRGREVLTFTDAGVVPDPGPAQLASSAAEAVRIRRLVVGDEAKVAFLSYSTLGSAQGRSVTRVREGVRRFRRMCPEVAGEGELQADAALFPDVARFKAPESKVAGKANVLVFPSLDAANIAYKLVQRLSGARALGPILHGLNWPLNDLSRGASVADIVHMAAITALMAGDRCAASGDGGGEA